MTVLFTDAVGSTEWRARQGDELADARVSELERGSRRIVEGAGGIVVKGVGDGVMATFRSAVAALAAATDLRELARGLGRLGDHLSLRIGVSSGDLVREGDDWYGTAAIEAARLCGEAEGDQVLVVGSTVELARGRSVGELRSRGPRRLRGFSTDVNVYELVATLEPAVHLPSGLAESAKTLLVGRVEELAAGSQLLAAVTSGSSRALLVLGEPGVGKTRLAAALGAAALRAGFTVLHGKCEEGPRAPYRPLVDALTGGSRRVRTWRWGESWGQAHPSWSGSGRSWPIACRVLLRRPWMCRRRNDGVCSKPCSSWCVA